MLIDISEPAKLYINKKSRLYTGKHRFPRIVLAAQSCRGSEFRLFFDHPGDSDQVVEAEGFSFLVEQELLEKFGGFKLDVEYFFLNTRILISPNIDVKKCTCDKG